MEQDKPLSKACREFRKRIMLEPQGPEGTGVGGWKEKRGSLCRKGDWCLSRAMKSEAARKDEEEANIS